MSAAQVNLKHPLIKALHQTKAQDEAVAKMVRPLSQCLNQKVLESQLPIKLSTYCLLLQIDFVGELTSQRHLINSRSTKPRPRTKPSPRWSAPAPRNRLLFFCRTTSARTAPCTSRRMCCPMHCASCCAPCQPLLREFFGRIRSTRPRTRTRQSPRWSDPAPLSTGEPRS